MCLSLKISEGAVDLGWQNKVRIIPHFKVFCYQYLWISVIVAGKLTVYCISWVDSLSWTIPNICFNRHLYGAIMIKGRKEMSSINNIKVQYVLGKHSPIKHRHPLVIPSASHSDALSLSIDMQCVNSSCQKHHTLFSLKSTTVGCVGLQGMWHDTFQHSPCALVGLLQMEGLNIDGLHPWSYCWGCQKWTQTYLNLPIVLGIHYVLSVCLPNPNWLLLVPKPI